MMIIKKNINICKILTKPRSLVFLNNSRSCPIILVKPFVDPFPDSSKPMIKQIIEITNMIIDDADILTKIIILL